MIRVTINVGTPITAKKSRQELYNMPLNWRDIGNGMMIQAKPSEREYATLSQETSNTFERGWTMNWTECIEIELTNQFPLKAGTQLLPGNINHDTVQKKPM